LSQTTKPPIAPTGRLPLKPILIILALAMFWGANWAAVKIGNQEFAPIFMAGLRSLIAAVCLAIWLKVQGKPLFPGRRITLYGVGAGILFGLEFALIYVGLKYTYASRVYVLLYTAPFFTALGAHFFLKSDRLTHFKVFGLILAFGGILALFVQKLGGFSLTSVIGDLMIVGAGALWGTATVYTKKYLAGKAGAVHVLFFNVLFSLPILFGMSLLWETPLVAPLTWVGLTSVAYQSLIVAFLTYLVWTELIIRYPVSLIHAFAFVTPVMGVFISGVIILREPVGLNLIIGLVLVSLGLVLVNRPNQ
jgi:drug/metabolite transporter (DMT)-like permease